MLEQILKGAVAPRSFLQHCWVKHTLLVGRFKDLNFSEEGLTKQTFARNSNNIEVLKNQLNARSVSKIEFVWKPVLLSLLLHILFFKNFVKKHLVQLLAGSVVWKSCISLHKTAIWNNIVIFCDLIWQCYAINGFTQTIDWATELWIETSVLETTHIFPKDPQMHDPYFSSLFSFGRWQLQNLLNILTMILTTLGNWPVLRLRFGMINWHLQCAIDLLLW